MTVKQWLAEWDAGRSVWSVEMGGLGPGYEQAIQVLTVELVRDGMKNPDAVASRLNATCGFSGAQVGVAKNLAANLLNRGPEWCQATTPADRHILINKCWPRA